MYTEEIRINGTVQGVGFRPTVYRIAKDLNLKGDICNDGEGVLIRICGNQESIEEFVQRIQLESPKLANINQLTRIVYQQNFEFNDFTISDSISIAGISQIVHDSASWVVCLLDLFNNICYQYK